MPRKTLTPWLIIVSVMVAATSLTSCGSDNSRSPDNSPTVQSSPTLPKTGFEADLDYVRKGRYTYIWVFARKDGKPLDKDDGAYLRTKAPQVVDWVTTDEGRKVIAGTNFDLAHGNLELLEERFLAEDYSAR